MNLEEFEKEFAAQDAAAQLPAMSAADKTAMATSAMEAAPAEIVPLTSWTSRRKWATSAAAVVVVGLAATSMNGAMVADRGPRLELTSGGNSAMVGDQALGGTESSKSLVGNWMMGYNFIADGTFSTEAQVGTAYKLVGWSNFESRLNQVSASFGMGKAKFDAANNGWTALAANNENIFLTAWVEENGFSGFQYIDNKSADFDCTTISSDTGAKDCTLSPTKNLPTRAAAEAKFRALLSEWNVSTTDLKFETYIDEYSVTTSATKYIEGVASPLAWSVTFSEDSRIQFANGSMGDLVAVGEYDLISPAEAIARANEISAKQMKAWAEAAKSDGITAQGQEEPSDLIIVDESSGAGEPSVGSGDDSSAVNVPGEIATPMSPEYTYEPVDMYVTEIKRGMQMAWLADGTQLWVPTYEFYGHEKGGSTMEWPIGSTIAIVESQFDLDGYTQGFAPMARAL